MLYGDSGEELAAMESLLHMDMAAKWATPFLPEAQVDEL